MLVGKEFGQIAWVVDDLDKAVRQWQETAGIGPFFVGEHIGGIITNAQHRGTPVDIDMSCAVAQAGPVQIELIKQHGDGPSPYRDVFADGEQGIHHVCSFVDDVEVEIRRYQGLGFDIAMTGSIVGETPVVYVDTRPMIGVMTELMGRSGPVSTMYGAIADAADGWDGTDPVRDFAALMG